MQEFLRRGDVAAKFAALLRHGATTPFLQGRVDPQFGRADISRRLAGFAGRGFIANVDVAIAHDCDPLLRRFHNA
jgi:hypothetical protein